MMVSMLTFVQTQGNVMVEQKRKHIEQASAAYCESMFEATQLSLKGCVLGLQNPYIETQSVCKCACSCDRAEKS